MRFRKLKDYQKDMVEELYKAGATLDYIAQEQDTNKTYVRDALRERNVIDKDRPLTSLLKREMAVCDMYRDDIPLEVISSQVLMSMPQVQRVLKKYGLKW